MQPQAKAAAEAEAAALSKAETAKQEPGTSKLSPRFATNRLISPMVKLKWSPTSKAGRGEYTRARSRRERNPNLTSPQPQPDILIQPADPDFTVAVDFDQANNGAAVDYNSSTEAQSVELLPLEPDVSLLPEEPAVDLIEAPTAKIDTAFSTPPQSIAIDERDIEAILTEAGSAEVDRDYQRAIRLYWQALGKENSRADIWSLLSRAYLIQNETSNAEATALKPFASLTAKPLIRSTTCVIYSAPGRQMTSSRNWKLLTIASPKSGNHAFRLPAPTNASPTTGAYALYARFIDLAPGQSAAQQCRGCHGPLRSSIVDITLISGITY